MRHYTASWIWNTDSFYGNKFTLSCWNMGQHRSNTYWVHSIAIKKNNIYWVSVCESVCVRPQRDHTGCIYPSVGGTSLPHPTPSQASLTLSNRAVHPFWGKAHWLFPCVFPSQAFLRKGQSKLSVEFLSMGGCVLGVTARKTLGKWPQSSSQCVHIYSFSGPTFTSYYTDGFSSHIGCLWICTLNDAWLI